MPNFTFTPNIQVIIMSIIFIAILCYIYYEIYILKSKVNYLKHELDKLTLSDKQEEFSSIPEMIQKQFLPGQEERTIPDNVETSPNPIKEPMISEVKEQSMTEGTVMDERQSFNKDNSEDEMEEISKDTINTIPHGLFTDIFHNIPEDNKSQEDSEEEQDVVMDSKLELNLDTGDPLSDPDSDCDSDESSDPDESSDSDNEIEEVSSNEYKQNETIHHEQEDYSNHTVKQLKEILISMNLPYSGNKQKLVQRIIENKK